MGTFRFSTIGQVIIEICVRSGWKRIASYLACLQVTRMPPLNIERKNHNYLSLKISV